MKYLMIKGVGDPNDEDGAYKDAIGLLFAVSYAIKMSYKSDYQIPGYYPYVVPPLEGLWTLQGEKQSFDKHKKHELSWISMIHQPDFVNDEVTSFQHMAIIMKNNAYEPEFHLQTYHHHEIYVKDNREPNPMKWRTILRQKVKRK